jgi:hypothetical protein
MDRELELQRKIDVVKKKMIESGIKHGLDHPSTIQISKELDILINEHMKITSKRHSVFW